MTAYMLRLVFLTLPLLLGCDETPAKKTSTLRDARAEAPSDAKRETLRVLMIGNSYSAGTRPYLVGFFEHDSAYRLELTAVTPGGRFLHQHAQDPGVIRLLTEDDWDAVIIQDQSQTPSAAHSRYRNSGSDKSAAEWFRQQLAE